MSTSVPQGGARAFAVRVQEHDLVVDLVDGRRIHVPLAWFPRLLHSRSDQRTHWRLIGDGAGIHWPEIDEDLSVAGLLRGEMAPGGTRSRESA